MCIVLILYLSVKLPVVGYGFTPFTGIEGRRSPVRRIHATPPGAGGFPDYKKQLTQRKTVSRYWSIALSGG